MLNRDDDLTRSPVTSDLAFGAMQVGYFLSDYLIKLSNELDKQEKYFNWIEPLEKFEPFV